MAEANPFADLIPKAGGNPFADLVPAKKEESDIPAFIRDVPKEIAAEAKSGAADVAALSRRGEMGAVEGLLSVPKAALGAARVVLSPLTGAARSVLGHPIADLETTVGGLINPEVAKQREESGAAYEDAKKSVDTALAAGRPSGTGPGLAPGVRRVVVDTPALTEGQEVATAGDRLSKNVSQVDVPRALASDSVAVQRTGQAVRNIPIVGDSIPKATARLGDQLEEAAGTVAGQFGGGSGPNVAHKIGETISSQAQAEAQAARTSAAQSDAAVLADWERSVRATEEGIAGVERNALQRARQSLGDMSPQDMGETLIARLRQGEQEARATKDRLYSVAGQTDAAVTAESAGTVRARVAQSLENDGRVVDGVLTPASSRMMDELQRFSTLNIENRAVGSRPPVPAGEEPTRAAVSIQGIEQTRKRLNAIAQAATNDADRAAARRIIREFDAWESDAVDNALFSGSPTALQAVRDARAANASWRQRFFNDRDDADRVINRIVTGEVTPQEVANYVIGASKIGSKGVSSRLLTRLTEATGGDVDAMNAIRGGVWNRLSQSTEGVSGKNATKVADEIGEFLNGSGRDVANRLFSEPQRAMMRAYADTMRASVRAREAAAEIAANTKPGQMEVGVGPFQQLAKAVIGGGRSDEALYSAINSYAKSGSRGDINLLSKVLQAVPQSERGNLASAMVRDMGVSPRTGQFSPDVFVSTWNTYRPEAKALLFGMSGPQRAALDDIAKISLRMKDIGNRFGNPSGTAQNVSAAGLGTGAFSSVVSLFMGNPVPALTLVTGVLGGATAAKMLSSPVGAAKLAQWSRAYEAAAKAPTPARIEAYNRASSILAVNVSQVNGGRIKEIVSSLQSGPVPAGAEEKQR
jgi:hypothetical protein